MCAELCAATHADMLIDLSADMYADKSVQTCTLRCTQRHAYKGVQRHGTAVSWPSRTVVWACGLYGYGLHGYGLIVMVYIVMATMHSCLGPWGRTVYWQNLISAAKRGRWFWRVGCECWQSKCLFEVLAHCARHICAQVARSGCMFWAGWIPLVATPLASQGRPAVCSLSAPSLKAAPVCEHVLQDLRLSVDMHG